MSKALAAALRQFIAEATAQLADTETSVRGELLLLGPFRGKPLYHAVQGIEQCFRSKRLPDSVRQVWRHLLLLTDEERPATHTKSQAIIACRLLTNLKRWAKGRLQLEGRKDQSPVKTAAQILLELRAEMAALRSDLNSADSAEDIDFCRRTAHRGISSIWRLMRRIGAPGIPAKPAWARRPDTLPGEFAAAIKGEPFDYKPPDTEDVHETLDAVEAWCRTHDTPAPASDQPSSSGGSHAPADRRRPKLIRNLTWYLWYHDKSSETHHSPAKIRDRWNKENRKDAISKTESDGGRGTVKQGIRAASKYLKSKGGIDAKAALSDLQGREEFTG